MQWPGWVFVEVAEDDLFDANSITWHMVKIPSMQHGALHL
jgi:hypothetical protein